jgi:hypothetical protein
MQNIMKIFSTLIFLVSIVLSGCNLSQPANIRIWDVAPYGRIAFYKTKKDCSITESNKWLEWQKPDGSSTKYLINNTHGGYGTIKLYRRSDGQAVGLVNVRKKPNIPRVGAILDFENGQFYDESTITYHRHRGLGPDGLTEALKWALPQPDESLSLNPIRL